MSNYILLQRKCWYARLGIPSELRPHFNGKRELKATLKTQDQKIAELKAMKLVSDWKLQFEALRGSITATQALAAEFLPHPGGIDLPLIPIHEEYLVPDDKKEVIEEVLRSSIRVVLQKAGQYGVLNAKWEDSKGQFQRVEIDLSSNPIKLDG